MVGIRHTDFRIGAPAEFSANHERGDSRDVALIGENLNVEHQLGMFRKGFGNAGGAADDRYGSCMLDGILNSPFDVAYAFEISGDLGAIRRSDLLLQIANLAHQ